MRNFQIFLSLIMALLCQNLMAQANYTIRGHVYEKSGSPLPGANITISSTKGAATDVLGNYSIAITGGTYTVEASFIGYEKVSKTITVDQDIKNLNFYLTPSSVELSDVVISTEEAKSINSISSVDIKLRPTENSQDILRIIPGLFIAQHAGGGKAEQIFLRGFDIDHGTDIDISVDGIPVNMVSHAHGQGYSDLHYVIPETLEKVDFNKGPYYSDHGDFSTAGYAAFHTKNSLSNNLIKLEGGQYGTKRGVAMLNLLNNEENKNKESMYLASEFYLTDGYFKSSQNFSRFNVMGKYSKYLNDDALFRITFSNFNSKWDASGQIPERAVESGMISRFGAIDDTEGGETSRTNVNIEYLKQLDEHTTFKHQAFFSKYDFNLVSNFTFFLNDPVNGDQITQGENRSIYGYKATFNNDGKLGNKPLFTEVGGGFRYDDVNDIHLSHTKNRKTIINDLSRGDIDQTNMYGYIREKLNISKKLNVNLGLRYDYFIFNYVDALDSLYSRQAETKGALSPKAGLNYQLTKNTSLFIKAGMGFHSNDTRVVVAEKGNDILPRAYGTDIGAVFKPTPNMLVNAAVWILDLDQEFVYVGDEAIVEPSGKTQRKGVDLSVRYQLLKWLYADIDVNLTDPKSKEAEDGEDHIPLAPTFTSIGGLSFNFKNGINGSLRYRFLDDRPANEDNSVTADGYFILDAVLNYTQPKYEIGLSVVNLLDTEWKEAQFETESRLYNEAAPVSEIHFTPGSPFLLKASLSYKF